MLRRILPAANAIFLGHLIVRLGSLVLVPLFLRYWSPISYGEYLALFAAVGYLASLDVGMQWATVNRLTQAYARNDLEEYRTVQHSSLFFYLVLSASVTLLVAGLVWLFPIPHWIGLEATKPITATLAIILLAAYVMWSMPMRLLTATYQTMGNMARSQWLSNGQQILIVLVSAVVLVLGGGMLAIASLQILTVVLVSVFVLLDIRRSFPALFPGIREAKLSVLRELGSPSLLFALLVVGNLIAYQGSILVVSAALGGLAVAALSVTRALVDVVRQSLYSINLALCPDFARMEALGEFEKLRVVHRITVAAVAAVTLAIAASFWYEGALVIAVWTRGRIEPDVTLLRLFLILMAFQTPWAASSTVATATNRHKVQAIGYLFSAILGIALVRALLPSLGSRAVPIGLTLGEAVGCYHFVIKATCSIIGESYSTFALRFWSGFGAVAALVLAGGWVVHHMMPGPMLVRWATMGLCSFALAATCGWIVWLTPADRALFLPKFRTALGVS